MVNKTKQIQQLMPQKPQAPKPLTKEEQAQQIARFLTQKREQYFQLILGNAIRAGAPIMLDTVDKALLAADHALEVLFPMPKEGEEK